MGMLQTCSFEVGPAVVFPRQLIESLEGEPERNDSPPPVASRQWNPDKRVARRAMGEEWAVVQRAIAGDARAQEQLFARHTGKLYRTAFALLNNRQDAEDAMQEGLCRACASLRSFQGRSSFSTWLTRIVINSALMTRRRRSGHPETSLDEILDSQPERLPQSVVDPRPDPEKHCALTQVNGLVDQQLRKLPPALRVAFQLSAINGFSASEASRALGIPVNTFKSRILRARRQLARGLRQPLANRGARAGVRKTWALKLVPSRSNGKVIEFCSPVNQSAERRRA
jgi:RNA polymerase sigma-70 factor, ECF subfamily